MKKILISIFILTLLLVSGCSMGKNTEAAKQTVDEFYSKYMENDYDGVIALSHEKFLETTSAEEYKNLLTTLDKLLGKVEEYSVKTTNVQVYTGGADVVELSYYVKRSTL